MKTKYILLSILAIGVIGVGIGLKMFFKPHADVAKLKADFSVSASDLLGEFGKDETAATQKYAEKVLEINGKLVAKNQLPNGTGLLVLEDEMQGISCQLDSAWTANNRSAIQELATGNDIKIKGVCKGYLMEIKVSPAILVK